MKIPHQKYVLTFNALPEAIRSYIVDGKVDAVVADIGAKYSFHVDVVGNLARGATYMLMGLMSPAELLGELVLAEINTDVAKSVLAELNQRIFIPIREEVHKASEAVPEDGVPEESVSVPAPAVQPTPVLPPQPQAAPASLPTSSIVPPIESVPAPIPQASAVPTEMVSVRQPVAPVPYPPAEPLHARTMAEDMEHASEGLRPGSAMPARSFQTASVPVTSSSALPQPANPDKVVVPLGNPVAGPTSDHFTKEYGSDPYREPVA